MNRDPTTSRIVTTYPIIPNPENVTPRNPNTLTVRHLTVDIAFSLAATCGPVAWSKGRWPHQDWRAGELTSVAWAPPPGGIAANSMPDDGAGEAISWRAIRSETAGRRRVRGEHQIAPDRTCAVDAAYVQHRRVICIAYPDAHDAMRRESYGPVVAPVRSRACLDGCGKRQFQHRGPFESLTAANLPCGYCSR